MKYFINTNVCTGCSNDLSRCTCNELKSCYCCGATIKPEDVVRNNEFHQDGTYCSVECLNEEMIDVEIRNEDLEEELK